MIARLVRKAWASWAAWLLSRRVERRAPELAALRKAEADARRQHKPVKHIHETRRAIVIARLAEETRRAS
jgi:hypothetical protein